MISSIDTDGNSKSLTRESAHDFCDEKVQILVLGRFLLELGHADLIQGFVLELVSSSPAEE